MSENQPAGRTANQPTPEIPSELQRSSRDPDQLRVALERALAGQIVSGTDHRITELAGTSANGMSSETLLFDASWREDGKERHEQLVARVAPDERDVPVFPEYDLPGQFRTIETVAALTDVPVPTPWWCEPDASVIGAPFFVMGRVHGEVPPDVMPYNFGESWLFHASAADQTRLQESSISLLARLHAIEEPEKQFAHLANQFPGDTALRQHVAGRRRLYEWAAQESGRSELIEKGFVWLEEHWPVHESVTVLNWGDSRIGNVLYRDFEPVGVLDWEMATLGPAELDLAWMVYIHQMFEDLAHQIGMPGMPDFLRPDDAATTYEKMTGHAPRDLDWYITYSCLQMAIILTRTSQRSIHFGEREAPASPEELYMNAHTLAEMISR